VLLSAPAALHGDATEEVALAVDEDDNLLWAAELRLDGKRTGPGGHPQEADRLVPRAPSTAEMEVDWSLGATPPVHRFAYLYGGTIDPPTFGAGQDWFVQARMMDPRDGELVAPPVAEMLQPSEGTAAHVLQPLAIPATGLRLMRTPILARDTHGRPVLWQRRHSRPLDVAVDADLHFDQLAKHPDPSND
jgi:hypothetical protein